MDVAGLDRREYWRSLIDHFTENHPTLNVKQFSSILDFQMFAAVVGFKFGKRQKIEGDKMAIPWRTVKNSETCVELINLIALAAKDNDSKILRAENDQERVVIFEEFAEAGFQIIEKWVEENPTDTFKDKIIEQKIMGLKNSSALSSENEEEDPPPIPEF